MGKAAQRKKLGRTVERVIQRRAAKLERSGAGESLRAALGPSPLDERQAANLALVEQFDSFAFVRNRVAEAAQAREHWAGVPLPIEGESLVIHPSYPFAEALSGAAKKSDADENLKLRNSWWSKRRRCTVIVIEDERGRVHLGLDPTKLVDMELRTVGCSFAWGIAQEHRALQLLGTLVTHIKMKQYLLTGLLLERSKRTGIFYLFRKLRPTVALRETREQRLKALAALCMHPIAYYEGSWAGAMCPTDDVIAHLMLMRGDEPMYWRRCNQHSVHHPAAGF